LMKRRQLRKGKLEPAMDRDRRGVAQPVA